MSLCELVVGGKEGLQPIEKTVIDRCVRLVYREQALGIATERTPLLQDLYEELLRQPEPEARRVATALELYSTMIICPSRSITGRFAAKYSGTISMFSLFMYSQISVSVQLEIGNTRMLSPLLILEL